MKSYVGSTFLGKKTIFGSHKKKKDLGLRSRKFSKILARQLSYTFHFHTKQILILVIFNKRYLEHWAMNIWYISDITVRAKSSSSEISTESFIYCLHHVQQRLWRHERDFSKLRATKIHSRTIRSAFQESRECGLLNSPKRASLTSTRFDQWLKPQEWYEDFLRNFYFEGNGPSMGVCLQKERENSLIMEGIKPTRDLRWPWRCISVEIFCHFQFEQVTRKPQQLFHFEFHYGKKKLDTPDMSIFRWKLWKLVLISVPGVF